VNIISLVNVHIRNALAIMELSVIDQGFPNFRDISMDRLSIPPHTCTTASQKLQSKRQ